MSEHDLKSMSLQATQLRKEYRFAEALPLFARLWELQPDNKWHAWGYGFCLKSLERYGEALNVARKLYQMDSNFAPGRGLYVWCIYLTEIRIADVEDDARFMKAARAIADLARNDDEDPCLVRTVMRVLRHLNDKATFPAEEVLAWSGMVHPENLDTNKPSFKDGRGREIELASQLENYYALRSKALLELGQYEASMALCREGLEKLEVFHYDNDVWFQRRIAQCHLQTGNWEEAEAGMKAVLTKKKDWFLYSELAEICLQGGKREDALRYSLQALVAWGDMDKKVRLLDFIAENFGDELPDLAILCTRLDYQIRVENNWHIGRALDSRVSRLTEEMKQSESSASLAGKLKKQAEAILDTSVLYLSGRLKSMLPNNTGGFIETDDGKTYFFKIKEYRGRREHLIPNVSLRFQPEKGFDYKKNRESDIALKVERIL